MASPDDTVTLQVGGRSLTGWQELQIVRGIELIPSFFSLRLTERNPGAPLSLVVEPGQTCQLFIGRDLIMSGYVDSYESHANTRAHEISVVGRSRTQDLVDCAAGIGTNGKELVPGMNFSAATLLQLAQDLSAPFGITVTAPDGEGAPLFSYGTGIPSFTLPLGSTVFDVLEPKARLRQMLMLDGLDGNLILAKVGKRVMHSGFSLPGNVTEGRVRFSVQDRFTHYLPAAHPFDDLRAITDAAGRPPARYLPFEDVAAFSGRPRTDGQSRFRPHFVISSENIANIALCEQLARWELNRRWGRSQAVTVTVPGWRDRAGALWTPNALAPLDLPALKVPNRTWLISQVAFTKGRAGTRSAVTLMPPQAFEPQPTFDTTFDPLLSVAIDQAQRDTRRPDFNPRAGDPFGGT